MLLQDQEIISLGYLLLESDEKLVGIFNSIMDTEDFFERFRKVWEICNRKLKKQFESSLMHSTLNLNVYGQSILAQIAEYNRILDKSAVICRLMVICRLIDVPQSLEIASKVKEIVPEIELAQKIGELAQVVSTESHLSILLNVGKTLNMAQQIANRNNWGSISSLIKRHDLFPYRPVFIEITNSYTNLLKSIPNTVEYFNDISLTESLHNEEVEEQQEELIESRRNQYLTTGQALIPLLESIDPRLAVMWQGAFHTIDDTNNPEHVRHFAISVRELLTRLLHLLAPDEYIKAWSQSPALFDNKGRPTRRARLLYITRNINNDPLQRYLEVDTKGILNLCDDLSGKTHGWNDNVTSQQIDATAIKAQHYIYFLLSIQEYNNKLQ